MKKFLDFFFYNIVNVGILFEIILFVLALVSIYAKISFGAQLIISGLLTVLCIMSLYLRNRNYFEQIFVKVCMCYKLRDDYKNYEEIKDIILTYKYNGQLDVKRNAQVVLASIERDKSNNIFLSAVLTVFGVVLGVVYEKDMLGNWYMTMYLLLLLVYFQTVRNIPRNAFIKTVVDEQLSNCE